MPKMSKFKVMFDEKGNLWVGGDNLKKVRDWLKRVSNSLDERVADESTRRKKRSKR